LVFLCLPHGEAAAWVDAAPADLPVVDLTADHRPGSGREAGWVYGLAEREGDRIRGAHRVANPGCYPSGGLLSLLPLHDASPADLPVVDLTAGDRPGSGREAGWVYGLAEREGDRIRGAHRVANPGCYPSGVLLSLHPLRDAGLVDEARLTVVDAASGVTGAGR